MCCNKKKVEDVAAARTVRSLRHYRGVPIQNLSRSISGFSRTSPVGLPLDSRTSVYWSTSVLLFDSRTPVSLHPMHCSCRCLLQRSLLREHILYSKRTHSRVAMSLARPPDGIRERERALTPTWCRELTEHDSY